MLDSLVYTSHATDALTDTELELVLLRSRVVNAARGLTGALLKRDRLIVQYLEGPPDALERTLAAIVASPLHREVHIHARAHGVQRQFDTWHMAFWDFQRLRHRDADTSHWLDAIEQRQRFDPANTPLLRLVAFWHELGTGPRTT